MTTPMNSLNKDQWKEVDERFDKTFSFEGDGWTGPFRLCHRHKDGAGATTPEFLKEYLHSELEKVRQETIEECVEALPEEITGYPLQGDEQAVGYKSGWNSCLQNVTQAISAITNKKDK